MMPEEWPIAAPAAERNAPARAAGRGRLPTVRVDFFLNPAERLTEQERALMTAMLHCLVGDIAGEIRAALPVGWVGANDDEAVIVDAMTRAGLLDDPELLALLLRRADEERIATAARARSGKREARVIQGLVSHHDGTASAAAMALILARGRRRDRFGQCLLGFDDLSAELAEQLVHAIAAALRRDIASTQGSAAADTELSIAASLLLARHDPTRGIEALTGSLVAQLDDAEGLTDELLLAAAQEGEVGFLSEALGRRAGIPGTLALDELLSGNPPHVMALLLLASFSRELSAGLLASVGDLIGIADPGEAICVYDRLSADEMSAASSWLATTPAYRAALHALDRSNG
ncbi:MAG TPA: DUF2336 domain-containing protein [Sphingomicrobium sp.]|jgi:hypothetical protein|nr:DUF2336 domain-containing protein [Sphingomicrobium sp.]